MNKIHFIGIERESYSPMRQAVNFFFENTKDEDIPLLKNAKEYDAYVDKNVPMSVSKKGREYFTVNLFLSNCGKG